MAGWAGAGPARVKGELRKRPSAQLATVHSLGTAIALRCPMRQSTGKLPRKHLLQGMRILAVEDHPDLRDLLMLLLEQQGAEVIGCESACQAYEVLVSGEPFDAAVFDISMPGEDGLSLLGRLRDWEARQPRHLPVIALTAHVTKEMESRCRAAGFDYYLPKPVSPHTLFTVLKQLAILH